MLSRGLVAILAVLGSAAGQQTTKPSGAKGKGRGAAGKGTGKGRGAPAKAMNLPELHKLRDEMRSSWCTGGRNAGSAPCQMEAFLLKYRSEPDAATKQASYSAALSDGRDNRRLPAAGMGRPLLHNAARARRSHLGARTSPARFAFAPEPSGPSEPHCTVCAALRLQAKKKTMMSTHVTEHAEKRKADPAGTKSKFTGDFFGMFNGFCAENPTKEHICKNKQLLHVGTRQKLRVGVRAARSTAAKNREQQLPHLGTATRAT